MEFDGLANFLLFGKIFGLKNLALFYGKRWDGPVLPRSLPAFGVISHKEELLNIRDNILQGSIRDGKVERQLAAAERPVIVDCGINVGVTVRWWYYLNPRATVYGIDMMKEANDFTVKALPERLRAQYVPITAVLAAESGRMVELSFSDPLFGGNRVGAPGEWAAKRGVPSSALDDCLAPYRVGHIELLKVDIEGNAAEMFRGAPKTLAKAKDILLEIHGEEERAESVRLLGESGFRLRRSYKRHLWFEKDGR